jgi:dual specificity protein kinase YAK1
MCFLQIFESFVFGGHYCIVVELLGMNLLDVLRTRSTVGLPIPLVQIAARNLFEALVIFKRCGIVHGDLKPENLVVAVGSVPYMKVVDFGQARPITDLYDGELQTLYYRAPEIVLGLPYGIAVDMWSVGCIIAELFLALPLFGAVSEIGLLHAQVSFLGSVPREMIEKSVRKKEFFMLTGDLKSEEVYSADLGIQLSKSPPYFRETALAATIMNHSWKPGETKPEHIEAEAPAREALVDLLRRFSCSLQKRGFCRKTHCSTHF